VEKIITVTNKEIISSLKNKEGIILLYPLKDFCVGYDITFEIEEIDDFVLINRLLTNNDLNKLKEILKNTKIKGIIFDDLGVLEIIKDLKITKILSLNHLSNNVISINHYLNYVDSVIISNDITLDEIDFILKNSVKKLVLNVFNLNALMYSRRLLLSNYQKFHELEINNLINASINDKEFTIFENEYGTIFFAKKYFYKADLLNKDNILYYWYNPIFLNKEQILDLVLNNKVNNIIFDEGFLNLKTIYKLEGDK